VEVNCTEPSLSVRFPWTKSHPIRHREKVPVLSLNFRLFRFRDLLQRIVVEVVVVVDEPVSDGSHARHFAVWIIDGLQKKLRWINDNVNRKKKMYAIICSFAIKPQHSSSCTHGCLMDLCNKIRRDYLLFCNDNVKKCLWQCIVLGL